MTTKDTDAAVQAAADKAIAEVRKLADELGITHEEAIMRFTRYFMEWTKQAQRQP